MKTWLQSSAAVLRCAMCCCCVLLPDLKRDADGGLTLYIQRDSPGRNRESNWLPAPGGPFLMFMRLYWPKPRALDGKWKQPPLERAG